MEFRNFKYITLVLERAAKTKSLLVILIIEKAGLLGRVTVKHITLVLYSS
jgi:hypothetical protein